MKRTFVIAEIGNNHGGDVELAERLIDAAVAAGADAAKFQSFVPEEMATVGLRKAAYQAAATDPGETQFARLQRVCLSPKAHHRLSRYCHQAGIQFCSSPFDIPSARLLRDIGVPFFKIPSGEITNVPLLTEIASYGHPVLLSTGMADLEEIADALAALAAVDVTLLHCTSSYPAEWRDANLNAITSLKTTFGLPVGFSDHTSGVELAAVAVGMGATVIEKHLTLDKTQEGGDHRVSLEPGEFRAMVALIRRVEEALGSGVKECLPAERDVRAVARKSIVARRGIEAGTVITEDVIALKRPGTGLAPKEWPSVLGATAIRTIEADQPITWADLMPAARTRSTL